MISTITQKPNAEETYNKLVNIAGENNFSFASVLFYSLFQDRDFWELRSPNNLTPKRFKSYVEFANYNEPWGLGWNMDVIMAHCKSHPEIRQEYLMVKEPLKSHGTNRFDIDRWDMSPLQNKTLRGNSKEHAIQRLKRDAPEFAVKVITGELSAKKAMEEAGLRKPKFTITAEIDNVINFINKHFTEQEKVILIKKIML